MPGECERVQALLPHYADGEVGAGEARLIREHIAACARCRREAAEWAALNRILGEGLRASEPVSADEIEAAVLRVREVRPIWRVAPTPVRLWRRWAPVAGLAAAAVLVALASANSPWLDLNDAGATIRDETAALALAPAELAADVPRDYRDLRRSIGSWPQQAVNDLAERWSRGAVLSQAVTRRVGTAPLAACAVLLLAANFAFARGVRSSHGRLQEG
jgi:hypothetical protein